MEEAPFNIPSTYREWSLEISRYLKTMNDMGREPDLIFLNYLRTECNNAGQKEVREKWADDISQAMMINLGVDVYNATGRIMTPEEHESINFLAQRNMAENLRLMNSVQYSFFAAQILPEYRKYLEQIGDYQKYVVDGNGLIVNDFNS